MPESVLTILKFCFLALLYLFLFRVVRVVVKELKAPAPSPLAPPTPSPSPPPPTPAATAKPTRGRGPRRLRILEPASHSGETYDLGDELTVGRGGGCSVVLADDGYVSTIHARVFRRDGDVFIEDLGSRNGTFLNGEPVVYATAVRRGDRVQFGQTIAEAVR